MSAFPPATFEPDEPPRLIVLAIIGGSGSGKTTLAEAVQATLNAQFGADAAAILSEDDYYLDSRTIEGFDPARYNFDMPNTKDFAQLARDLRTLQESKSCMVADYDHSKHAPLPEKKRIFARRFIILEGMHALLLLEGTGSIDVSVYLQTPDDVRLARRLMRDITPPEHGGRGRQTLGVITQYFRTVREGQLRYVEPQRAIADLVLADDNPPPSLGGVPVNQRVSTLCASVMALLREKGLV
jgi:uridine kinase